MSKPKVLIFLFYILIVNVPVHSQQLKNDNFNLFGQVEGMEGKYIYLVRYSETGLRIKDSSKVEKSKFYFKGAIKGFTDIAYIKINGDEKRNADSLNTTQIVLENASISISLKLLNFSKFKISGSPSYKKYAKYLINEKKFYEGIDMLNINMESTSDSVEIKKILDQKKKLKQEYKSSLFKYCTSHTGDNFTPYVLYWLQNMIKESEYKKYIDTYNLLNKYQKNSYYGKRILITVNEYQSILNSKKVTNFLGKEFTSARNVELKSIVKEKEITLLAFWASWCIPCRRDHKALNKLYEKYKKYGFEVVAISDDTNYEKWEDAIIKDSIQHWKNFRIVETTIKTKQTANGLSNEYFLQTLPLFIVVDKNMTIISRFNENCIQNLQNILTNKFNL